jgi:hypothetical protein
MFCYHIPFFQCAGPANFDVRIPDKSRPGELFFLKPSKLQTIMKKYIAILMLAPILGMLSCDRETANNEMSEENMQGIQYRSTQYKSEPARTEQEQVGFEPKETGDDDEPQDDKQHWKVSNNSIS